MDQRKVSDRPAPGFMKTAKDGINCPCTFRFQWVGCEPQERRIREEGIQGYQTYGQLGGKSGMQTFRVCKHKRCLNIN
ncbi:hypothetical protein [Laceyella putida]|uniref:Uncharacterized protein n=1 Tax=Laceyella putida TaxID=110101 RepID=A0ABW2RNB8_9BACL